MGCYDILFSFAIMMKVFRTVDPGRWGALGNDASAIIFSSILLFGMIGSQFYNVGLSIYYLFLIKYNYKDKKFRKKVEPFIHFAILFWALGTVMVVLATGSFNPGQFGEYWITPSPTDCKIDENVDCLHGEYANILRICFVSLPLLASLIANIGIMIIIWFTVMSLERKMNKYSRITSVTTSANTDLTNSPRKKGIDTSVGPTPGGVLAQALAARASTRSSHSGVNAGAATCGILDLTPAAARRNRRQQRSVTRSKVFLRQAALYTGAFLFSYASTVISKSQFLLAGTCASLPMKR
jgi:hypothetical protein